MAENKLNKTRNAAPKFKDTIEKWCQVTTCAGIIDLYMSKGIIGKVFWTIFIAFCCILTLMQLGDVFEMFFTEYQYKSQMDVIDEERIPFPNVTICNFNRIDETLLSEDVDKEVFSYLFHTVGLNYNIEKNYINETHIFEPRWEKMKWVLNVTSVHSLYKKYGHTCEDTFIFCKMEYYQFDCCKYATEVIMSAGRCWSIQPQAEGQNDDTPIYQSYPGVHYGLQLIINPKIKSYLKNVFYNNMLEEGVIVLVGYSDHTDLSNYKVVSPGMHSWMLLKATLEKIKTYTTPLWPPLCKKNTTLSILSSRYSKENCEIDCWAQIEIKRCNCTNAFGALREQYQLCSTLVYFNCILSGLMEQSLKVEETVRLCSKGCLNPCDPTWSVEVFQTSAKFLGTSSNLSANPFWQNLVPNTQDREEILNSLIAINFYFSSSTYTVVETGESNPILIFIGNIGGQLSLFLGISVVTIIQMIWYLCVWLFPKYCSIHQISE